MEKAIDNIRKEVLEDKEIKKFLQKNKITDQIFDINLPLFYQQKQANDICNACLGKKECQMDVYLMQSMLEYYHGNVNLKLVKCKYVDIINEDLLDMMFFPKTYEDGEWYVSPKRKPIFDAIAAYFANPKKNKGFYIHGSFGTGKTFILVKIARELTKKNIKVIFAYYPDLVRHIKGSFANNGVEAIVNKLKNVDVLMLDDIGGENNSGYIRDEILGPILQYRMLGNMPTFMSSNYSMKDLIDHFMETKDGIDRIKSERIIERIKFMMDDIELKDVNLRQNN